jgi:mycothiol synthase
MEQAPEEAQVVVQHFVRESDVAARALLQSRGHTHVRTHYWMAIEMHEPPPEPIWPEGIEVHTFREGEDEDAVFEAGEESFADIWGRPPTLWFLARDSANDTPAAICLCKSVGDAGYVGNLGVRRPSRRQGLGLALLHHAFGEFYRREIRDVMLSVDAQSLTGAPRLYSRAGMHVRRSYTLYRKVLREGQDLSTAAEA